MKEHSSEVFQEWVQRYDYQQAPDGAVDLALDDSGNVYVTGSSMTTWPVSNSYATIKYNPSGVQQWVQRFPASSPMGAKSIAVDDSSNVYVTGTCSYELGGFGTVKYTSNGSFVWARTYRAYFGLFDTANAYMVKVDKLHNVYVTGKSKDSIRFTGYTTIKYSNSGLQLWASRYNGPLGGPAAASAVAIDDSGNVYVTGTSKGAGIQQSDIATIKYNSSGVQQWVQRYTGVVPGYSLNRGNAIVLDNCCNIYVAGEGTVTSSYSDFVVIKYNSAGIQQWVRGYDGIGGYDEIEDMVLDNSGNIYVTGQSAGYQVSTDCATIKYNSDGVQQWVQRYHGGASINASVRAVALDSSGGVYITGALGNGQSKDNYFTIKYNNSGIQQWLITYNGPGNGGDGAGSIGVDKFYNVYITGRSFALGTGDDYATIKYNQLTGIEPVSNEVPGEFNLYQNYPNPFNPITKIKFSIPPSKGVRGMNVRLTIYDVLGREVTTLANQEMKPGSYEAEWNGTNYTSGVYFYKLITTDYSETKKMVLIK